MKKMSNTNWQELVNQAKNNDQSAITKLYELTNQNAYFVAISMMKNEDDTFDIMQNAYIKAFDKLDTLENPEKFQSWLNQIVSNECKMALRKHRDFVFSDFETEDGYDFGDMIENDNIEFNPDSNIEYEETKQAMEEILHKLPDEQRLVVLMFYFQEFSIKEIAQMLDCSENTVKSRLNYAKKKIKTEVEELERNGHKLYGIAPLPLFLWFIRKMAKESSVPKALSSSIAKALSASAATISSGAVAGTVAKTGLTLAHKIIIGVVATAVAVTGAVAGVTKLKDVSSTPEEMTNQSAEVDAPTPITEDEIIKLLYDSLEYYDAYLYGRGYASTEKIDMGNPIIEKDGYYIEECKKYNSYDECMASLREYYSENAIKKIIEKTNLTAHDGKCYMNIFEGVGDPGREIKSIDSIDKIGNTTYAINMTLNNYFEEKEEPSVMYCIYENGHWVMDSINYYEPMYDTAPETDNIDVFDAIDYVCYINESDKYIIKFKDNYYKEYSEVCSVINEDNRTHNYLTVNFNDGGSLTLIFDVKKDFGEFVTVNLTYSDEAYHELCAKNGISFSYKTKQFKVVQAQYTTDMSSFFADPCPVYTHCLFWYNPKNTNNGEYNRLEYVTQHDDSNDPYNNLSIYYYKNIIYTDRGEYLVEESGVPVEKTKCYRSSENFLSIEGDYKSTYQSRWSDCTRLYFIFRSGHTEIGTFI